MAGVLEYAVAAAFGAGMKALEHRALLDVDGLHLQFVDIGAVVVLGIGDGRLQHFLDDLGALLRAERENVERLVHRQAADQVGDEPSFLRRQADTAQACSGLHGCHSYFFAAGAGRPAPGAATFLSAEWPLNVRVSANSPSLWPTMFSEI